MSDSKSQFDANLNDVQIASSNHVNGPAVVFAGAGSGKTLVICSRIAKLIQEQGVPPYAIVAVTFTNKAAKEMQNRVENMVGPTRGKYITVSTFHSFCARYLRIYAEEAGYSPNFSIFDDDDQKTLFKDILKKLAVPDKVLSPLTIKIKIDRIKNKGLNVSEYYDKISKDEQFYESELGKKSGQFLERIDPVLIAKIYMHYQERLKSLNAMDFNDLLLVMYETLKKNEKVLASLQDRFQYFLVDEFQDTNPLQFHLIQLLASRNNNLFIVGDDDQSIYSWRGAEPSFIIQFTKIYPSARAYKLEKNYRSTKCVVDAASHVIQHNTVRAEKTLFTDNVSGERVTVKKCFDGRDEARFVMEEIFRHGTKKTNQGDTISFQDFCILYRTNAQSRVLEDECRRRMIPYVIYGSLRFYERAEIKLMLSYLRILVNPSDDVTFEKIMNVPRRGIGEKSIAGLKEKSLELQTSLYDLCFRIFHGGETFAAGKAAATNLNKLINSFTRWQKFLDEGVSLGDLFGDMVQELEINAYLSVKYPEDIDDRKLNIIELKNALIEFEATAQESGEKKLARDILGEFLERALLTVEPRHSQRGQEENAAITLMTIHSSKGLEFPQVYLCGLEENTLPHYNSIHNEADVEEERRLLYVAMTRAQKKLTLTYTSVNRYKSFEPAFPSRFLDEIPNELKDVQDQNPPPAARWTQKENMGSHWGAGTNGARSTSRAYATTHREKLSEGSNVETTNWRKGQRIAHKTFGEGTICDIEKSSSGLKLSVQFDQCGRKTLLESFVVPI